MFAKELDVSAQLYYTTSLNCNKFLLRAMNLPWNMARKSLGTILDDSFDKFFLSLYFAPDTDLGARDTTGSQ